MGGLKDGKEWQPLSAAFRTRWVVGSDSCGSADGCAPALQAMRISCAQPLQASLLPALCRHSMISQPNCLHSMMLPTLQARCCSSWRRQTLPKQRQPRQPYQLAPCPPLLSTPPGTWRLGTQLLLRPSGVPRPQRLPLLRHGLHRRLCCRRQACGRRRCSPPAATRLLLLQSCLGWRRQEQRQPGQRQHPALCTMTMRRRRRMKKMLSWASHSASACSGSGSHSRRARPHSRYTSTCWLRRLQRVPRQRPWCRHRLAWRQQQLEEQQRQQVGGMTM